MNKRYWIVRYQDGIVCQDCGIIISNRSAELACDEFHSNGLPVEIVQVNEVSTMIVDQHATFLPQ